MRQHVVYILDLSMTLTFDLYAGGGGGVSLVSFTHSFYLVYINYVQSQRADCMEDNV